MDKYEYNLKIDQMKTLCAEGNYTAAAELADSISWNKVKNVNALVRVGEIYEKVGRYEESKEILLCAYDRSPIGRMIIYRLAEVAVKMKDFDAAEEYYQEFVEIAPHDNLRYVLRYEIEKGRGTDISKLIDILEEFKEKEYTEEWAFELASLYHQANESEKCVGACDELILWFGDGPYVERALELKMLYQPLTKVQEEKYRKFRLAKEGITTIGADEMKRAGEYVHDPVEIPQVSISPERFNTVNLQKEIAKGMQQIIDATEKTTVNDTIDNIKKIVGDNIPYLQLQKQEEAANNHIETDEEIDGSLKLNFQEFLGEENDGQMSLVVNEKNDLERQITGQITIEDVLEEWEKTKRAAEAALQDAEQRRLESAKARALQEAGDIMDRLNDVIPQLDAGVSPKELLEKEYLSNAGEAAQTERVASHTEEVAEEITPGGAVVPFPTEQIQGAEEEFAQPQDELAGGQYSQMTEIPAVPEQDMLAEGEVPQDALASGQYSQMAVEPTMPETAMPVEEAFIQSQDELTAEQFTQAAEDVPQPQDELPQSHDQYIAEQYSQMAENAAAPEQDMPVEEELPQDTFAAEQFAQTVEEASQPQDAFSGMPELPSEEELLATALAATQKIGPVGVTGKGEPVVLPELSEEKPVDQATGKAEGKLPKVAMPEDLGLDDEEPEETVIDHLTDEQKAIFSYFVPVKGMESQLCQTLTHAVRHLKEDRTASTGNIIIQGGQGCGKTMLATSIIKVLQKECGKPNGKVGKIDAQALNKKDIQALLRKVSGGCLIIERAGDLSRESAVTLSLLLAQDDSGVLVILEDTTKGIRKALMQDDGFAKKFTERVSVPIFTNDELVAFARAYAKELGYEIDEMAVLALYNRISNIQRLDQATTLTEVKEIVDEAIDREAHGGIKKAISILTAARYTDDDCIVLREKDFK